MSPAAAGPVSPPARVPFTVRWPEAHLQREEASEHDLGRGLTITLGNAAVISDHVDDDEAMVIVHVHGAWRPGDEDDEHTGDDVRDELAQWLADLVSGHTEDVEQAIRHRLGTVLDRWRTGVARTGEPRSDIIKGALAAIEDCTADVERALAVGNTR